MKSRRRCAHREVGVDHAHDAALDEVDGLLRGDRRAPVLFAPPVADEDGRGREQKGGGHAQPLQDAGEQDRDVEDAAGARIEQPGRGANGVRTGLPRVAHGLDHHATSAQDGACGRGQGVRVGGAGRPGILVGRGETKRLGRQSADNDLVGLDEGRQRRTRPAPAAVEPPVPRGQHGQAREYANGGCAVGSVGSTQVDSHVGRPGLIDLKQARAIQCHGACGAQHRVGRVPGQVPGLGDLATAIVLDERERHLQRSRRRRLGDARPDCQGLSLLVIGCEHGRVRAGITRARALRERQADRHHGRGVRHGVGVTDHGHALDLNADGVQRVAAGTPAAVDGGDELTDLGPAGVGADEPEHLVDRDQGGQRPVGVEITAVDRLIADVADLVQFAPQTPRQGDEVASVGAASSEDADLGGQVRQVGEVRAAVATAEQETQPLGRAAVAQGRAQVALQVGREDAEESSQDEIAIIELHGGSKGFG